MATKTYTINIDGNAAPSMAALRKEARELDKVLGTLPAGSAEAAAALQRLADVKGDIGDLRDTIRNLDPGERLKSVIPLAEGISGAFSVATVAAQNFGLSGASLEEYQTKLQALIATTQGLAAVQQLFEPSAWSGAKAIWVSIVSGLASVRSAFTLTAIQARLAGITIRSELVATGIGALVVALGLVVANFDKVKAAASDLYQRFRPALEPIVALLGKLADGARNVGSALTFGLIDNASKARVAAAEAARGVQLEFEKSLLESDEKIAKSRARSTAAQLAQDVVFAAKREQLATRDYQNAVAALNRKQNLSLEELRAETLKLAALEASQVEAARKRVDAEQAVVDFRNNRFNKQRDNEIAAIADATTRRVAEIREAGKREVKELEKQGGDVAALRQQIALRVEREVAQVQADARKQAAQKAKEAAEKTAADRLEVERNTSKLLIAGITDETLRRLEELDEQAKQERAQVKGTAEQKKLQISLIDQNLARDRAKTQAEADKARLDKARETAQREVEILQQRELALVEVEVQAAQRNIAVDGSARVFKARLQQLEVQKKAELSQVELTEEAKQAIVEKYLNLTAQLEREAADDRFNTLAGSIQRATQAVSGIVQALADEATTQLDAQLQGLQERLASLDDQLADTRSRIESDEKSLETAVGARRAFLIAKIEQEKKAEAALRAERTKAAAEQLTAEKERQKLADRAQRANQLAVAVETILATVEMVRTAAKSGQFAGPAAPFVIAATAAAGVAAAVSLRNALKFREGGLLDGPTHEQGGIRGTGRFGNVEVEGGEFIVNRKATAQFLPVLQHINEVGRTRYVPASQVRFAAGGVLPTPTTPTQSNSDVVLALGRIEQRLVSVEHAVMIAPTLAPKPVLRIGMLEAEAISEQQANAAQQKALATF